MFNGSDFEWHSKTKQPDHYKSDQRATILDSYFLVLLSYSSDHLKTVAMVLIIIIPNLTMKTFGFRMGFEFEC